MSFTQHYVESCVSRRVVIRMASPFCTPLLHYDMTLLFYKLICTWVVCNYVGEKAYFEFPFSINFTRSKWPHFYPITNSAPGLSILVWTTKISLGKHRSIHVTPKEVNDNPSRPSVNFVHWDPRWFVFIFCRHRLHSIVRFFFFVCVLHKGTRWFVPRRRVRFTVRSS